MKNTLFDDEGNELTGWRTVDGKCEYFSPKTGKKVVGWIDWHDEKYYTDNSGKKETGWLDDRNQKYHLDSYGQADKGITEIEGNTYYFDNGGAMQTGYQTVAKSKYYFACDGKMQKNIYVEDKYIDENGIVHTLTASQKNAKKTLDNIGWDINKAFNYAAGFKYEHMTTDYSLGTEYFAEYGFENGKGNCITMAAVFYRLAERLGYKVKHIGGAVPYRSRQGQEGPHSWVEILIDGNWYVADPAFTEGTGLNGFKISYGQKGTWKYIRQTVMEEN